MNVFLYSYNLLTICVFLLVFPFYWLLDKFHFKRNSALKQRLGIYAGPLLKRLTEHPRVWIHASSVGEVKVAHHIIDNLRDKYNNISLVLSTATVSGNKYAKKLLQDKAVVILAPFDLYFCVRCALLKIKPNIIVYVETEIWPNWINAAFCLGITIIFLNGRISKRSVKGYRKIKFLIKSALDKVDVFSMASYNDRLRIISIGAPENRIFVNGNAKFDLKENDCGIDIFEQMYNLYELFDDPPVFVAGSIRGSEEQLIIDAYIKVKKIFPKTILIIAPRHLRRAVEIEKQLKLRGLSSVRRSSLGFGLSRKESIIILDTIGELYASYSVATVTFCGASLVKLGGQNILEAAIWAKPVIHGPFMDDFRDAVDLLQKSGASIQVNSGEELAEVVIKLLNNIDYAEHLGTLAKEVVLSNCGSSVKHAKIIGDFIEKFN